MLQGAELDPIPHAGAVTLRWTSRRPKFIRALSKMSVDFPEVEMLGVVTDFSRSLDLEGALGVQPVTFPYPGSSIGNFMPADVTVFLGQIRSYCAARPGSGLMIGVDCKKGQTNIGCRLGSRSRCDGGLQPQCAASSESRLRLWTSLSPASFTAAFTSEAHGRIEMHLEALRDQVVHLNGAARSVQSRRTDPYREFLQIRSGGIRIHAARGGISLRQALVRWGALIRSVLCFLVCIGGSANS